MSLLLKIVDYYTRMKTTFLTFLTFTLFGCTTASEKLNSRYKEKWDPQVGKSTKSQIIQQEGPPEKCEPTVNVEVCVWSTQYSTVTSGANSIASGSMNVKEILSFDLTTQKLTEYKIR